MILTWGTLFYSAALLLPLLAQARGWPISLVMSGISVGLLAGGFASPKIGKAIDQYGGHYVMAAGSLLGGASLAALPFATSPAFYFAVWAALGVSMAANLYDPAFATLTRLFGADARKQITLLTLMGGFASTVSWPATHLLLGVTDWRGTYFIYAAVMVLVVAPLHAFALPRTKAKAPMPVEGAKVPAVLAAKGLVFVLVACAFATFMFAQSGMLTHMLLIYERMGVDRATAVFIGALFGPAQVAARICELAVARHTHPLNVARFAAVLLIAAFTVFAVFGISAITAASGKWKAGDGIYRRVRFREKMDCAILSGHRRVPPFGLAGGEPGHVGENRVRRLNGKEEKLKGCDQTVLEAGEAVIIVTPTGGGYGRP